MATGPTDPSMTSGDPIEDPQNVEPGDDTREIPLASMEEILDS